MKRDNFVLVCVYSASDLNDESRYSVKVIGAFISFTLGFIRWKR